VQEKIQRLQRKANELSIKIVGDSRTNLEESGNDMIQVRSDSNFGVKFLFVKFYTIEITPNPVGSS
jgi:hypothetical protein